MTQQRCYENTQDVKIYTLQLFGLMIYIKEKINTSVKVKVLLGHIPN